MKKPEIASTVVDLGGLICDCVVSVRACVRDTAVTITLNVFNGCVNVYVCLVLPIVSPCGVS